MNNKDILHSCRLYGIIDLGYTPEDQLESVTQELLDGGIRILQLRAKGYPESAIEKMAERLITQCRAHQCLFIVNDYPEIAAKVGADGVHVGQDDGDLATVRQLMGPDALIGRSTHSPEQANKAWQEGADYIGFGPLFPTGTKPGRPAIGLDGIAEIKTFLPQEFPVFCIGGINSDTLDSVLRAGAERAVIVSWLLSCRDRTNATRFLRERLGE